MGLRDLEVFILYPYSITALGTIDTETQREQWLLYPLSLHAQCLIKIMQLILYSKPGCHLCEGLQEKLETILQTALFESLELEVRDINTREDWFAAYQYEIPVLCVAKNDNLQTIPRPSPRTSVAQLEKTLRKYI